MKPNNFFKKQEESHSKLNIESKKSGIKALQTKSQETHLPHIHSSSKSSSGGKASGGFSNAQNMGGGKGGVVVKGQTVIVKSNFSMAGRKGKDGNRATKASVGKHASASINYMDNHGAEDIKDESLSNVYNEDGERLSKEELYELRKEMDNNEDFSALRRIVIDPGQQDNISREEMVQMVIKTVDEYKEKTGADFKYKIAIHTDKVETGGNIHAHVVAYGSSRSINMTKDQMKDFKQIAGRQVKETLDNKQRHDLNKNLNTKINKEIAKTKESTHEKGLTLNQQIDKLMDGKLDDKHNEIKSTSSEKDDISKAIEAVQSRKSNDGLSL
ncbi:MAG: hypothetical protein M0P91_04490 [Sulfuricurvum sp.]|jgi:hypothetical protein|uniref:hypothetical protein n=1 Tax=Sulfuricurvum sp. TaxID=2025608 RepID=UPI0025F6C3A5|nr:hypothetical protein [Sulfuricurvum sp.]MCK9372433.1 hypothetical protein [Sulfuricurvum sp.]